MADLRVARTKELLRQALLDLCSTRQLGDVTVKDLLEKTQVSRAFFYRHYRDVDDLAQDVWLSRLPYFAPPYPRLADYASPSEACRVLLDALADELLFFKANPNFARGVSDQVGRSSYYRDSKASHVVRRRLPICGIALSAPSPMTLSVRRRSSSFLAILPRYLVTYAFSSSKVLRTPSVCERS